MKTKQKIDQASKKLIGTLHKLVDGLIKEVHTPETLGGEEIMKDSTKSTILWAIVFIIIITAVTVSTLDSLGVISFWDFIW